VLTDLATGMTVLRKKSEYWGNNSWYWRQHAERGRKRAKLARQRAKDAPHYLSKQWILKLASYMTGWPIWQKIELKHEIRLSSSRRTELNGGFEARSRFGRMHWAQTHSEKVSYHQGGRMHERIEAFLLEVLEDEGKDSNVVRANTRCYVALYIEMFRAREAEDHKKDDAAQRCHDWCRQRVLEELDQREGTSTADHLRIVLNAIEDTPLV
jgi:hypothetical protein